MSMGVRGKLLFGVGASLALLVLAALFGLVVAWQRLGGEVPPQVAQSERIATVATDFRIQVQEWKNVLLRGTDPAQLDKYWKAFEEAEAKVQAAVVELAKNVEDPELKQSLETLAAEHRTLGQAYRTGLAAFRDGGFVHTVGDAAVKGVDRAATAQLGAATERAAAIAGAAVAESAASSRRVIGLSIGAIAVIVVLLLIGLPLWMDRAIVRPARDAVRVADAVARGDLSVRVAHAGDDEFGQLARALQGMVSTLQQFSDAQTEMARAQDAGEMSARIQADRFRGSYADMADAVNAIAGQLIATTMRVVEVNERYARGDFSARMEALPGEKAKISQAMDAVRTQFVAMRDEVGNLAQAAARGEFSVRGDASGFQHDFKGMVDALNTLMSTAENGIGEVGRMLRALADGDLRQRIRGEFHGMFDTLKSDANETAERLAAIIAEIRAAAEAVDTAAQEIAAGNADLSGRTEQQAANLEETASSMEELTSTVKQNADNARHANDVARNAGSVAAQGGEVVQRVVATMGEISASSARIGDIIGVIDGIAFQTNILALNAAVEAARAGEQGRGFAVVASEVRSLAQRSADAAKEIKALIQNSGERVDHGAALVSQAGSTMSEIVGAVRRLTDIIAEIAAASAEQSSGIEQVNSTVVQMDQATQQNAALVEEASAAARTLEQQARELKRAVSAFAC